MESVNMDTCGMKLGTQNLCAMCQYGHVLYEVSFSIPEFYLYIWHVKDSAMFDVYIRRRVTCKTEKFCCVI